MTSLAQYGQTGRRLTWAYFAYRWYREITDESLNFDDVRESLYLGAATLSLMIPDPISTAMGYTYTKIAQKLVDTVKGGSTWWAGLSLATRTAITYTLFTPVLIAGHQQTKAITSTEPWDEQLGQAMWEAQAVPDTERLVVPQSINPMTGSRVF